MITKNWDYEIISKFEIMSHLKERIPRLRLNLENEGLMIPSLSSVKRFKEHGDQLFLRNSLVGRISSKFQAFKQWL